MSSLAKAVLALAITAVTLTAIPAGAQSDSAKGKWTTIPAKARSNHTATFLAGGTVLVVGGCVDKEVGSLSKVAGKEDNKTYAQCQSPSATAEIYHPASKSWKGTRTMRAARGGHTATLLGSGKVLVVGGFQGSKAKDPTQGLGGAKTPVEVQKAIAELQNKDWKTDPGIFAEVYDPETEKWTKTADPVEPAGAASNTNLLGHTSTLLGPEPSPACGANCGKVLVAGSYYSDGSGGLPALLYDPVKNSWDKTADAPPNYYHTASVLKNGKVLFSTTGDAHLFDPATATWAPTESSPIVGRGWNTATVLCDGNVLMAAGVQRQVSTINDSDMFVAGQPGPDGRPTPGQWRPALKLAQPRAFHTAALLRDGSVMVAGGVGEPSRMFQPPTPGEALATAEIYDVTKAAWKQAAPMKGPRAGDFLTGPRAGINNTTGHTATVLGDGTVLVVGGGPASAEIYTPAAAHMKAGNGCAAGTVAAPAAQEAVSERPPWIFAAAAAGAVLVLVFIWTAIRRAKN